MADPTVRRSRIRRHTDLDVYRLAFGAGMTVFHLTKTFPTEERYSLTDQIRRSSRSVCGNIAEGWRKRRYSASFVSRLNDSEAEAAETQSWLQFAVKCEYIAAADARKLYREYDEVIAMLIKMQNHPTDWALTPPPKPKE